MAKVNELENKEKQLGAQLHQLQELKFIGLLAYSIVHRFNNAIGIIRGYAELSLMSASLDDRNRAYLEQIIDGADFAKELAEKMIVFNKQRKMDFELINIHSVVEQAVKKFEKSLLFPINIQQDIDAACAVVLADADQAQQIVINLCSNAYEAMRERNGILKVILKEIDVGASFAAEHARLNEGKYIKLTVSDTGRGMDEKTLKQIYKPFFTTKKIGKNAGLGLAVVDEIVKNHKGEIAVESRLGEGTKFDVFLPLTRVGK